MLNIILSEFTNIDTARAISWSKAGREIAVLFELVLNYTLLEPRLFFFLTHLISQLLFIVVQTEEYNLFWFLFIVSASLVSFVSKRSFGWTYDFSSIYSFYYFRGRWLSDYICIPGCILVYVFEPLISECFTWCLSVTRFSFKVLVHSEHDRMEHDLIGLQMVLELAHSNGLPRSLSQVSEWIKLIIFY